MLGLTATLFFKLWIKKKTKPAVWVDFKSKSCYTGRCCSLAEEWQQFQIVSQNGNQMYQSLKEGWPPWKRLQHMQVLFITGSARQLQAEVTANSFNKFQCYKLLRCFKDVKNILSDLAGGFLPWSLPRLLVQGLLVWGVYHCSCGPLSQQS